MLVLYNLCNFFPFALLWLTYFCVADEMGLWHHEVVPVREVSEAKIVTGIPTAAGIVLKPDFLTAKISLFAQPNTVHIVCTDASYEKDVRSSLKTKHLNPGW